MSEDIRVMTAQLAADPTSLVFLPLGEALRQRRQLDAARKVVLAGLSRYPDLADAHDLFGRILGDHGDFEQAFDEWGIALRLDPKHAGAHKGIGFLYFVAGKHEQALDHLQQAREARSDDEGVNAAIARVEEALAEQSVGTADGAAAAATVQAPGSAESPDETVRQVFAGLEGAEDGLLLVDQHGRRLGGGLRSPAGEDVADRVSALMSGVSREANRAARLLDIGDWEALTVESTDGNLHLAAPTADTILFVVRDPGIPLGRLAALSDRAAEAARDWLESLG
jgi:predicted regulator of Ras-like GTPase activity (Roadblock/LC7/MglB family)